MQSGPGHVTITATREYSTRIFVRYHTEYSDSRVQVLIPTGTSTGTSDYHATLKTCSEYSFILVVRDGKNIQL